MKLRVSAYSFPTSDGHHEYHLGGVWLSYDLSTLKLDPSDEKPVKICYISDLTVEMELRGKKLGTSTMQLFIQQMKDAKVDEISLTAIPSGRGTNEVNLKKFYESLGFKDLGDGYFKIDFRRTSW